MEAGAKALLRKMEGRGLSPNVITYNAAISACEKGEQWEYALALLRRMEARRLRPDAISYCATISACGRGGQWERVLSLLDQMEEGGLQLGVGPRTPATASIHPGAQACTYGKHGSWQPVSSSRSYAPRSSGRS